MIRLVIVTGSSKPPANCGSRKVGAATGRFLRLATSPICLAQEAKGITPLNLVEATSEHVCMEFVEGVKHEHRPKTGPQPQQWTGSKPALHHSTHRRNARLSTETPMAERIHKSLKLATRQAFAG